MARQLPDPADLTPDAARTLALRWLGQRELSTAQVRDRLRRRHYDAKAIDVALETLTAEGLLNDERAARARARHDAAIKRHGPARVLRQVRALGVDRDTARSAVEAAFDDIDADRLLEDALARRLRHRPFPTERKDLARLYAWLVGQGFEADKVSALLRRQK